MNKKDIEKLLGGKHGAISADHRRDCITFHYNNKGCLQSAIKTISTMGRNGSFINYFFLDIENIKQHIKDFREEFNQVTIV